MHYTDLRSCFIRLETSLSHSALLEHGQVAVLIVAHNVSGKERPLHVNGFHYIAGEGGRSNALLRIAARPSCKKLPDISRPRMSPRAVAGQSSRV